MSLEGSCLDLINLRHFYFENRVISTGHSGESHLSLLMSWPWPLYTQLRLLSFLNYIVCLGGLGCGSFPCLYRFFCASLICLGLREVTKLTVSGMLREWGTSYHIIFRRVFNGKIEPS